VSQDHTIGCMGADGHGCGWRQSRCTPEYHAELRRLDLPQPQTENRRAWTEECLELAECVACGSTLSVWVGPAREEA
jgi:hypothetical protein